jgi:hypothetical protein
MISNEYGFNFVEIPHSGTELFLDIFLKSNSQCKISDEKLDSYIEYHTMCIVKSPYLRASHIYRNGNKLRKENDLKTQSFVSYFENNLNKWDSLDDDIFYPQYHYIKNESDIQIFKYEELLDNWFSLNEYISEIGLSTLKYFSEPAIKNWHDDYKEEGSAELVEYIFEDDFENLGYSKL